MTTALVLVTGDLDSAALLATAKQGESELVAVTFSTDTCASYWMDGASSSLAAHYKVAYRPVRLYEVACLARKVGTFHALPNRVMTSVTLLTTLALTQEASEVWLPYHKDSGVQTGLLASLRDVVRKVSDGSVRLVVPFLGMSLPVLGAYAANAGVPLALTHSCLVAGPRHCGKCEGCRARRDALAGVPGGDPTEYLA